MSAFIVSKRHIDYMLTAGLELEKRYGAMRWLAPAQSVPEGAYQRGEPWGPDAPEHYADRHRELTAATADRVGVMLVAENYRSVNHRYDEHELEELYEFERYRGAIDPVQVLKAVHCYEYQSCETPEWERSEAWEFCRALKARAERALPGYEDAKWGMS